MQYFTCHITIKCNTILAPYHWALQVISVVAIAQLVEPRIVIPVVEGSSPFSHPILLYIMCFQLLKKFVNSIVITCDAAFQVREGSSPFSRPIFSCLFKTQNLLAL